MPETFTTTCYIQVRPEYYATSLRGIKAVRLTQHRPADLLDGCVAVRVRLTVPREIFDALSVDLTVDLPETNQILAGAERMHEVPA